MLVEPLLQKEPIMKFTVVLMIVLLLFGCTRARWIGEGKTWQQEEEDYWQCENEELKKQNLPGKLSDTEIEAFIDKCMKAKGYHDREK